MYRYTIHSAYYLAIHLLLAASLIIGIFGCATQKPIPDLLKGFSPSELKNFDSIPEIKNDCDEYISGLPGGERRGGAYLMQFYEDGTGQHAITFKTASNGIDRAYILIYDKTNKRIKAVRYVEAHYAS
jgi:hypothetical protein